MLRAHEVRDAGNWPGPSADTVVLDYDDRHRRRLAMTGQGGLAFLLDLGQARALRDGDGLVLEDGRIVEVRAAPERLLEVTCASPAELVRVAWHLGNRHLPTELIGGRLRIRYDHVIANMLEGLGARVAEVAAPFNPEGGAYAQGGHRHPHGHGHDHDNGHHGDG